jgi:hypothetical protein
MKANTDGEKAIYFGIEVKSSYLWNIAALFVSGTRNSL